MTRSQKSKPLPPPTPSEAAFERLLASFGNSLAPARSDNETLDDFAARMFAQQKKFLERDPFAGIGQRDTFPTKIMGVSFEGRQDVVAGLKPGAALQLERQPQNQFDSNAIAVWFGNLQLGFLRKEIAKHLAPLIDAGADYRARAEHITGGRDGKNFGVNIRVYRETGAAADAFAVQARAQADH